MPLGNLIRLSITLVVFTAPTLVEKASLYPDTSGVTNTFFIHNPCLIISQLVDLRGGNIDNVDVFIKEKGATDVGGGRTSSFLNLKHKAVKRVSLSKRKRYFFNAVDNNVKWKDDFLTSSNLISAYHAAKVECDNKLSNFHINPISSTSRIDPLLDMSIGNFFVIFFPQLQH